MSLLCRFYWSMHRCAKHSFFSFNSQVPMFQSSCFIKDDDGLGQGNRRKKFVIRKWSPEIGSRRHIFPNCVTNSANPDWLLSSQLDPHGAIPKLPRSMSRESMREADTHQRSDLFHVNTSNAILVRNTLLLETTSSHVSIPQNLNGTLNKGGLVRQEKYFRK